MNTHSISDNEPFRKYRSEKILSMNVYMLPQSNNAKIPLSDKQKSFCQAILSLDGVEKITMYQKEVTVYKKKNAFWGNIDLVVKNILATCTITEDDLQIEEKKIKDSNDPLTALVW